MYKITLNKDDGSINLRKIQKNIKLVQVGRRGEKGDQGDPGTPGAPGQGVPVGGTTGQVLAKDSNANYDTEWIDIPSAPVTSVNGETGAVVLDKSDIGLGNVDNTSDTSKPISTATQTALNLKADDSDVVHIAGSETITGIKTFDNGLKISPLADVTTGMGLDGNEGTGSPALRLVNHDTDVYIDAAGEVRLRTDNGVPRVIASGTSIDVTGLKVTSVADPVVSSDAANKGYVDDAISGIPSDAVTSVFGRTGAVVAISGDYTASQITNVPAGGIAATTVQAALNELDTEKAIDSNVVHKTGDETIAGNKTLSNNVVILGNLSIGTTSTPSTISVVGTFSFRDAEVATKAFRYAFGGAIDVTAAGGDAYYSVFDNADFTGDQAFHIIMQTMANGGNTLFNRPVSFNDGMGDIDFRVKGDTDSALLFADASTDRIGIGTDSPATKLHVAGGITYGQTTEPTAATNTAVQWTASGSGTKDGQAYEQGDVLITSNVGGVSKTLLIFDWSAA